VRVLRDITNERFGHLIALRPVGQNNQRSITWLCQCDCGSLKNISSAHLRPSGTRSCGCKRGTLLHGHAKREERHPLYQTWKGMRHRCNNPNHKHYKNYGGRDIKICTRWNNFENFIADMGERPPDTSLDRINSDGDYEPANCKWSTRSEQAYNRRRTSLTQFTTEELIAELARRQQFTERAANPAASRCPPATSG